MENEKITISCEEFMSLVKKSTRLDVTVDFLLKSKDTYPDRNTLLVLLAGGTCDVEGNK